MTVGFSPLRPLWLRRPAVFGDKIVFQARIGFASHSQTARIDELITRIGVASERARTLYC